MLGDRLGFPISWNKVSAGEDISWIGFETLLHSYSSGITASRNDWAIGWCTKSLEDDTNTLADGLGRLSFICDALETLRIFLSPQIWRVRADFPPYILLTLRHLTDALKVRHHQPCGRRTLLRDGLRVDAPASRRLGLGGWRPVLDGEDQIQTALSPWFHERLTPANCL